MAGKACLSAALVASGACGLNAFAAPELEIKWAVNGGTVNIATPEGTGRVGGTIAYDGEMIDPATGLLLQFSFTGAPLIGINGNFNVLNDLTETIEVSVDIVFPLGVVVREESLLRGSAVVGLTGGLGGAKITSVPSPPWLWRTLIDGAPAGDAASLFYHPFELSMSGPGNAAAFADFGSPDPVVGPPIQDTVGYSINFTVSDLDLASITSNVTMMSCPGDLDGDGIVSTPDLILVLFDWGECPPAGACDADLNGDGIVGTDDLLTLLEMWGECPMDEAQG